MKKSIIAVALALVAMATLMTACKKNEDFNEKPNTDNKIEYSTDENGDLFITNVNGEKIPVTTDKDGYAYVKATFPSGLLFASGKYALNASAKNDLATFARSLDADMDVCIYGYTDNDPWRGYTAEQSVAKNQELSLQRAGAVRDQLLANGLQSSQIREISGLGESNPVASNATAQGKEQNRRVEVFILPSKAMVEAANAEAAAAKQ